LIWNKILLNRLIIGINVYLIVGSFGLLTGQVWLNQLYGNMGAAGMLAVITIVGVVSLALSPEGFIGITSHDRKRVIMFSLYLLVVAQVAFLCSYYFLFSREYTVFRVCSFYGFVRSTRHIEIKNDRWKKHRS